MPDGRQEQFIANLTSAHGSLYAFILSLLPDPVAAEDLLQETNLTLWRKRDEFEEGTSFRAWACQVAYFKVLSYRRRLARDRHIFDDELVDYIAERQISVVETLDRRRIALRTCLQELSAEQRDMVADRYRPGGSVKDMAERSGRSVGVVSQTLYRLRHALMNCIEQRLQAEPTSP